MNKTPSETCLHCGAETSELLKVKLVDYRIYECGVWSVTLQDRTELCIEREARHKVEAELNIYKRKMIECSEACEPLRGIKGLEIGDSIMVDGVKLMIRENAKLRELLDRALYHRGHGMGCYTENYDYCECGSDSVQEDYDELKK